MSDYSVIKRSNQSLKVRCISALREARKKLRERNNLDDLLLLVEELEDVLFSAETKPPGTLLECYVNLTFALKNMETQPLNTGASMRPIGLQVATSNNIVPIHLEWNYHHPDSLFVIEYANFEDTKPNWRVYRKTRSTSFTVRDLPLGKAYWFRISALASAV